jgi:hypothetical protein
MVTRMRPSLPSYAQLMEQTAESHVAMQKCSNPLRPKVVVDEL